MCHDEVEMSISELGSLGEFLASMGVLVTLVFLALQVRQNTNALKVSSYADFVSRHMNVIAFEAQHSVIIAKSRTGVELSHAENIIVIAHVSGILRNGDALFYQRQQGLLDQSRWESALEMVVHAISESEGNRKIWEIAQDRYEEEYRSEINRQLLCSANPSDT
jgi:hypothetical protein